MITHKVCKTCKQYLPIENFPTCGTDRNKRYYKNVCRCCYNAEQVQRTAQNKKVRHVPRESLVSQPGWSNRVPPTTKPVATCKCGKAVLNFPEHLIGVVEVICEDCHGRKRPDGKPLEIPEVRL